MCLWGYPKEENVQLDTENMEENVINENDKSKEPTQFGKLSANYGAFSRMHLNCIKKCFTAKIQDRA